MPERPQPARALLRDQRYTTRQAAVAIDVEPGHLASVLAGHIRPHPVVRERLPELLGVPLEDLFDADRIDKPYFETGPVRRKPIDLR